VDAAFGYALLLIDLLACYMGGPLLHEGLFKGSTSLLWTPQSFWSRAPANSTCILPLYLTSGMQGAGTLSALSSRSSGRGGVGGRGGRGAAGGPPGPPLGELLPESNQSRQRTADLQLAHEVLLRSLSCFIRDSAATYGMQLPQAWGPFSWLVIFCAGGPGRLRCVWGRVLGGPKGGLAAGAAHPAPASRPAWLASSIARTNARTHPAPNSAAPHSTRPRPRRRRPAGIKKESKVDGAIMAASALADTQAGGEGLSILMSGTQAGTITPATGHMVRRPAAPCCGCPCCGCPCCCCPCAAAAALRAGCVPPRRAVPLQVLGHMGYEEEVEEEEEMGGWDLVNAAPLPPPPSCPEEVEHWTRAMFTDASSQQQQQQQQQQGASGGGRAGAVAALAGQINAAGQIIGADKLKQLFARPGG
jgi:hypothetical protein